MGKQSPMKTILTRSSVGVRTRSGRKAYPSNKLVSGSTFRKPSRRTSKKTTPTKQAVIARNQRKGGVTNKKVYKFAVQKRISERKEEFGLKRASSRIAMRYILTEDLISRREELFKNLYRLTWADLENNLKLNDQSIETGSTKKALALKIAEGVIFGAAPKCICCRKAEVDFDFQTGKFTCRGYDDPEDDSLILCEKENDFSDMICHLKKWKF